MVRFLFLVAYTLSIVGCAGIKQTDKVYSAHAESFNILGLQVPGKSHERAMALVPENGSVDSVIANENDWTSIYGVINRLFGVEYIQVSGKIEEK
ncbi:hypothetical protein ACPV5O_18415 [Vibrio maritimus]|uniref:hypothetical protein n=1 Tax=Vibrio maritimus TaxID=990268 RepID=UPI0040682979